MRDLGGSGVAQEGGWGGTGGGSESSRSSSLAQYNHRGRRRQAVSPARGF